MFKSISFANLKASSKFGYAAQLPYFKERESLNFTPGLNVLFGPNGCGKSTILKMLGGAMCATQGGVSTITESALRENVDLWAGASSDSKPASKAGLHVVHDGKPVVFSDPRMHQGLMGGSFDDDFFEKGVIETSHISKRSHGQAVLARVDSALATLLGKVPFPDTVDNRLDKRALNDTWKRGLTVLEEQMASNCEAGLPTVLLDEPEANFSLVWQARIWKLLAQPDVSQKYQVIVASHSPFALGIAHANYIDFEAGFRQECEAVLVGRFRPASA